MNMLLAAAERVQAAATNPPVTELGHVVDFPRTNSSPLLGSWAGFTDRSEWVPELRWPHSIDVLEQMRSDPQIAGLYAGMFMPVRRYSWHVSPNAASDQTVAEVAEDLGLPIEGEDPKPRGRSKGRFSHDTHLRHALLAPHYGHMFFEQVGAIDNGRWRLRRLAPRLPRTILNVFIANNGDLVKIQQKGTLPVVDIPAGRLASYVWDREGANWVGRSLFRACYGPWLIKQRLVRVDAIKHERNGMGIPLARQTIPETDPAALSEARKMASAIRAGEVAGAALPYGFDVDLKGVSGTLPDTLASIRYCDEAMARSVLMMFMQLGQTQTGSRALGSEFIDFFALAQEAVADWYADTTTEHVIEDWVDWNEGETVQAPTLGYARNDDPELSVADLVMAIDAELVVVSEEDEVAFRERFQLPSKGTPRRTVPVAVPPPDLPT